MGWQWHQLEHMQIICISLQTDNHASPSPLNFLLGRMLFLTPNQQCRRTEGIQVVLHNGRKMVVVRNQLTVHDVY